jgi:hypothetical protein
MDFDPASYGRDVEEVLALDGSGLRLIPLVTGSAAGNTAARLRLLNETPRSIFPEARAPEAALAGLWVYFSCFEEGHKLAQDIDTPDGSYWHGILHRQEPDPGNAGYWFRRAGQHPVFPALREKAKSLGFPAGGEWNPFQFIEFCEEARRIPGSEDEVVACRIQLAEWQLLFDYCARPSR